jgi:hypothetical protein
MQGPGKRCGDACVIPFTVGNVPTGLGFYGIEISHRGRLQHSETDLRHGLDLTLG